MFTIYDDNEQVFETTTPRNSELFGKSVHVASVIFVNFHQLKFQ
jgi:hypothetical protein